MPEQKLTDRDLMQVYEYVKANPDQGEAVLSQMQPDELNRLDVLTARTTNPGIMDILNAGRIGFNATAQEVAKGAVKGVRKTVIGLGRLAHELPGIKQIGDAILPGAFEGNKAEQMLGAVPENAAQSAGMTAEQIGEFFVPAGAVNRAVAKLGTGVLPRALSEGATAFGVAKAQGDPAATVAAGLGAAGPIAGKVAGSVAGRASEKLRASGLGDIVEGLNPTRHRTKVKTARIAPEIQKRGLVGSMEDLNAEAKTMRESLGEDIGYEQLKNRNVPIVLKPVRDALAIEEATTSNLVKQASGVSKEVVHDPRKRAQIERVRAILDEYGDTMTTEQAIALRKTWDDVIARAGGFDEKATREFGVSLDDASEAGVLRPVASAMRKQLAEAHPDTATLNKEFKFWADLEDVTNATKNRRVGQKRGGLLAKTARAGATTAGAVVGMAGGAKGSAAGAVLAGELAERASRLFNSPKWKLVSAREKTRLADALASGNKERIGAAIGRATAAMHGLTPVPAH